MEFWSIVLMFLTKRMRIQSSVSYVYILEPQMIFSYLSIYKFSWKAKLSFLLCNICVHGLDFEKFFLSLKNDLKHHNL